MAMIAQVNDVLQDDGTHVVTAITEEGNVATSHYSSDWDRDSAYEKAQQDALNKD